MTEEDAKPSAALGTPRVVCAIILLAIFALPRLPFYPATHLFTPIDKNFLNWYVGGSAVVGYFAYMGFFTWGNWNIEHAGLSMAIGIFGLLLAPLCGMMAYFTAEQFYGYYELEYLPHQQRERLYAVTSISSRGRGGDHAWVMPYGMRTWGLPLSIHDYRAHRAGELMPPFVCYRVTELRNGRVIGIVEPPRWHTPDALVPCRGNDPRRVAEESAAH